MPTFIDESGDTGQDQDSKPYFRLAAVWMPCQISASEFRESVTSSRREFGLRNDYEFRFSETHRFPDRCERFYGMAMKYNFRFAVCCFDKLKPEWSKASKEDFYYAASASLATTLRTLYLQNEIKIGKYRAEPITVDDNGDRKYLEIIKKSFRGLNSAINPRLPLAGTPKFENSKHDALVQLADMTCGAVGQWVERNGNDSEFYNMIRQAGVGLECGKGKGIICFE